MVLPLDQPEVKVSIGLPVYNGEKYIRTALNNILSQTFKDFELIISDNASTDATQQICQEYASQDKRIRYIRQSVTVPIMENFSKVLELARGDCFMWATHDDYYGSDNYLAALYSRITKGFTFVFPNANILVEDNEGHITYANKDVYLGLHRRNGSKYEMSKDFVRVYGEYLYGMQIYGMFKLETIRDLMNYYKKYSKTLVIFSEGRFLHKIFSSQNSSFVDTVYFNYLYHGANASAIKPQKVLIYYLYYTYFVISIYLSSSFSVREKRKILFEVVKIHSKKIQKLFIFTFRHYCTQALSYLGLYNIGAKA